MAGMRSIHARNKAALDSLLGTPVTDRRTRSSKRAPKENVSASSKNSAEVEKKYDSSSNEQSTNRSNTMAPATTASKRNTKSAATKAKTAKSKPAEDEGVSKRELAAERDAELQDRVVELREQDPPATWGEIAEELSIQPGKAMLLAMKAEVEATPKLKIKFKDEDELAEKISEAREAADEYSSWGFIAARTGLSEGKVKKVAAEAGVEVAGSRIASVRAAAKAETEDAPAKKAPAKGKTAAKGRTGRGRKGAADPSK